jgi:hypothetical protein
MPPSKEDDSKRVLKGEEAWAFHDKLAAREEKAREERLANAKREAARRGKEPFDLQKLERLYDTRADTDGRVDPVETRRARYEWEYYTYDPNILTIDEFAKFLERTSRW